MSKGKHAFPITHKNNLHGLLTYNKIIFLNSNTQEKPGYPKEKTIVRDIDS